MYFWVEELICQYPFGNDIRWIMNAMTRSLDRYKNVGLDVIIVSFRSSSVHVQELIYQFNGSS